MLIANNVDPSFMLYTMWLDAMKDVASHCHGNILSFDGSNDGFEKTLKQMQLVAEGAVRETKHN